MLHLLCIIRKVLLPVSKPAHQNRNIAKSPNHIRSILNLPLSNSSWANYGYLVAYEIGEDLMDEMERLNQAFGIGIIRLQAHQADTKVLFPAKEKQLDYTTIGKLSLINSDFSLFINNLSKVMLAGSEYVGAVRKEFESICDTILVTEEELEAYCKTEMIPY